MARNEQVNDPSTPSLAHRKMSPRWHLLNTVLGGTEAMREAGSQYLPKHHNEPYDVYEERLERSVFTNVTELTLDFLVGKPFAKQVSLNEDVPDRLREFSEDIDLQGNDLHRFCQLWFREALHKGFAHVLIDTPAMSEGMTLDDQRRMNLRPYWVQISPDNLIAAEAQRVRGHEMITHVRFFERDTVFNGFEEVEVLFIVSYDLVDLVGIGDPEDFRVQRTRYQYAKGKKGTYGEWEIETGPELTGLKEINLVTFYANREGFMECKPPLLDLAYLNVAHWQSESDQRSILTVSRFPILAASGVSEYDQQSSTVIGPHGLLQLDDPAARFYYVEHSGAAIEAGRKDLQDLEARMAMYGAQLLTKRPDRETASARILDEASVVSPLQRMTYGFMDAVATALYFTARLTGLEEGGTVTVNTDFGLSADEIVDLQTLVTMRKDREISHTAFIGELKRRGVLHEKFDITEDVRLLKSEAEDFPTDQERKEAASGGDPEKTPIKGGGSENTPNTGDVE